MFILSLESRTILYRIEDLAEFSLISGRAELTPQLIFSWHNENATSHSRWVFFFSMKLLLKKSASEYLSSVNPKFSLYFILIQITAAISIFIQCAKFCIEIGFEPINRFFFFFLIHSTSSLVPVRSPRFYAAAGSFNTILNIEAGLYATSLKSMVMGNLKIGKVIVVTITIRRSSSSSNNRDKFWP